MFENKTTKEKATQDNITSPYFGDSLKEVVWSCGEQKTTLIIYRHACFIKQKLPTFPSKRKEEWKITFSL